MQITSQSPSPGAASISSLFVEYLQGDPRAADDFARLLHPLLIAYFRRVTGDREQAEDLAQECWTRIHVGRSSFRVGMPVMPWIFGVARYTRLDAYRRVRTRLSRELAMSDNREYCDHSQPKVEDVICANSIVARLKVLPASQRKVFLLYYVEDLSQLEISEIAGCTTSAVKQKVFRARTSLRESLRSKGKQRH